jgi:catechol 2,3-dioxygenase-like lactoylglutathione lyase family enzyme
MSIRRIVPDIQSNAPEQSKEFYRDFLGLNLVMDMGWVETFASSSNSTAQITIFKPLDSSSPQPNISIEVDDIQKFYSDAQARGLVIRYPLTTEPWGVTRFFVEDPNGIIINILTHTNLAEQGAAANP